jgi:FkbM family methyltransferase
MNIETLKRPLRRLKIQLKRALLKPSPERFSEIDLLHELLTKEVRGKGVMVDVGAQFGESFLPFRLYGWQIVAFEPDPNPRKHAALAKYTDRHVEVLRVAVSDAEKPDAVFFTSEESTGISSLSAFRETHRPTAKVRVSTLALELSGRIREKIDFLKIDTEGYDFFVLRGFPWKDDARRPRAILCEFEDAKSKPLGYLWTDMATYLHGLGYRVFVSEWHPIVRYGAHHRWRGINRFPCSLENPQGWGNLVAFRDDADADKFAVMTKPFSQS